MSIRFAARNPALRTRIRPSSGSLAFPRAANDNSDGLTGNGATGGSASNETGLTAALRHFARHGLGAAQEAHDEALAAFVQGNEQEFAHWRNICAALDGRLALRLPHLREMARLR